MDDNEPKRKAVKWRPVVSLLIAAAAGFYAWRFGLAALPPIIAIMFLGCAANVFYGLLEWSRPAPSVLIDALKGISLMLSAVCGSILVFGILWAVFSAQQNPFTRLTTAEDVWTLGFSALVLAMFLMIAAMGILSAYTVWLMVRHNAFGSQRSIEPK